MVKAESHFNPKARSHKNAKGLMQLMHFTAKKYGVKDRYHPFENLEGGIRYLKDLLDKFNGNEKFAVAAYNAGPRRVKRYKGIPPYKETRNYVRKVMKYKRDFYGFKTKVSVLSDPWNRDINPRGKLTDSWRKSSILKV
jgi:soluble lytic murein transglycosylase-like protein